MNRIIKEDHIVVHMKKENGSDSHNEGQDLMVKHGALMDVTYRYMKYIYDITRPFFLAGRSDMRRAALLNHPTHVCEIGTGTARNLILMAKDRTGNQTKFTGLDVSSEMINFARKKVAKANLGKRIDIRLQDFADYLKEPPQSRVYVFSYSLSMIPNWEELLRLAAAACREHGGRIVIVDFSTMESWPVWVRERLRKNLTYFHVFPRYSLESMIASDPAFDNVNVEISSKFGGYAAVLTITF